MTIIHTPGSIPGREGEQQIAIMKDDTHLSRWIEAKHCLDADLTGLIPLVLDLIPEGATVLDVGASLGDHTAAYATKAAAVHGFEPQPEPFECLSENCEGIANIVLHNCGLSDRPASLRVHRETNMGASHIAADGDVPVEVITLDSLCLSPALIKWDIEGHEVRALRGARQTLLRCRPVMVMEVNGWGLGLAGFTIRDMLTELMWLGYSECADIRTGQPFNPDDGRDGYDIVCRP